MPAFSFRAKALIFGYSGELAEPRSHCWTKDSSRSIARCRGFWQVRLLAGDAGSRQQPANKIGGQRDVELLFDPLSQSKDGHHLARPQREREFELQRVLPRHRAVNPLYARAYNFGGRPNGGLAFNPPTRRAGCAPASHTFSVASVA